MDWNRVEGNWKQVKGQVKEKWGKLTDDDLTTINGKRDQLEGKIQERYGLAKDQVKKDVDDWYCDAVLVVLVSVLHWARRFAGPFLAFTPLEVAYGVLMMLLWQDEEATAQPPSR